MDKYDVIIIGTGAGGGTLALELAATGKRILLLERGDYLPREKDTWSSKAVFTEGRYLPKEQWRKGNGEVFQPFTYYYVGGNTKFYGAALLRLRERDFEEVQHSGGLSPAWPLRYADFEPYYARAEKLWHVHGQRGADPTDPPRSGEYPYPAISHEPRIQQLNDDLERLGYHPFPLQMGLMIDEKNPQQSKCIRCNSCDGYACVVQAKADAHVVCIAPALQHPNVTMMTRAYVERLETDASGRVVTKAIVRRDGETIELAADIFVIACGAINSAALMLRSSSDRHPNGLANSSDMVGRHYMSHHTSSLIAISKEPNHSRFPKTLGISDFYWGSDDWQYPMGFIQMLGKVDGEGLRGDAAKIMMQVLNDMELDDLSHHSLDFWLQSEDLPDPDNRVTLTQDGQIVMNITQNNHEGHERLTAKLKSILSHIGAHEHLIPIDWYLGGELTFNVAHQCGTLRFGDNPRTSVLDVNCKAHDLANLYSTDGGFMVSSGAVNPTLTIIANSMRVADHLKHAVL